jgi:hypothetical protein
MPTARDIAPQLPRTGNGHRRRPPLPLPGQRDEEWEGISSSVTGSGSMAGEDLRPYARDFSDEDSEVSVEPYWATWGF